MRRLAPPSAHSLSAVPPLRFRGCVVVLQCWLWLWCAPFWAGGVVEAALHRPLPQATREQQKADASETATSNSKAEQSGRRMRGREEQTRDTSLERLTWAVLSANFIPGICAANPVQQ